MSTPTLMLSAWSQGRSGMSAEDIYYMAQARKAARGRVIEQMALVRDTYQGDLAIPLPELDARERPSVANLLMQGVDALAERIASTLPDVFYPPVRPGIKAHMQRSDDRRKATLGWWNANRMNLILRQRSRHLLAYGQTPVKIEPDPNSPIPKWVPRNPLSTLPPDMASNDVVPSDCIFTYTKRATEVAKTFHIPLALLSTVADGPASVWEVLEYVDERETVLCLVGPGVTGEQAEVFSGLGKRIINIEPPVITMIGGKPHASGGTSVAALVREPNPTGKVPVIIPGRITLGRIMGHFDGMIGSYQLQARLGALAAIAVEQDVWPDEWAVGRPNENVRIVKQADGRAGITGVVEGAVMQQLHHTPGAGTFTLIDRLERSQRLDAGIPAEWGGECVDEATEILTADGWKNYIEVGVGTEVLTLNHETGLAEWQPVQRMNVSPVMDHDMLLMEGQRFSSLTTLNHRWPVISRWNGARKWKHSETLTSNDHIPTGAYCSDLPTEAKWSDALVEAVAWFYTEGSFSGRTRGQISQSLSHNPENVERIRACLTSLFGPATPSAWRYLSGCGQGGVGHDGIPRWREEHIAKNGVIRFGLSAHAVRTLLDVAPNKVPTFAWLRTLTQAQLDLFIAVSMLADNCGPARFGQKDRARSEAFGFACILAGRPVSYRTRVKTDSRPEWPSESTSHVVRFKKQRTVSPIENARVVPGAVADRVTHHGIVWCPTTENGTWLARRNGLTHFTGNSASNIRTGRRGDQVLSATIDFPIQEQQEILAASMSEENKVAIGIAKSYWGSRRMMFDVTWGGKKVGQADYTPDTTFDSDVNQVSFTHAGADQNSLVVGIGQRVGLGTMSVATAQQLDPLIDDPANERRQVLVDKIEAALVAGLQQQAEQLAMAPHDMALLLQRIRSGQTDTVEDAVLWLQTQVQNRQATTTPTPAPGTPEAQPGLAAGTPAEAQQGPAQVQPPSQDISNLTDLVRRLHGAQVASAGGPTGVNVRQPTVGAQLAQQGA